MPHCGVDMSTQCTAHLKSSNCSMLAQSKSTTGHTLSEVAADKAAAQRACRLRSAPVRQQHQPRHRCILLCVANTSPVHHQPTYQQVLVAAAEHSSGKHMKLHGTLSAQRNRPAVLRQGPDGGIGAADDCLFSLDRLPGWRAERWRQRGWRGAGWCRHRRGRGWRRHW